MREGFYQFCSLLCSQHWRMADSQAEKQMKGTRNLSVFFLHYWQGFSVIKDLLFLGTVISIWLEANSLSWKFLTLLRSTGIFLNSLWWWFYPIYPTHEHCRCHSLGFVHSQGTNSLLVIVVWLKLCLHSQCISLQGTNHMQIWNMNVWQTQLMAPSISPYLHL